MVGMERVQSFGLYRMFWTATSVALSVAYARDLALSKWDTFFRLFPDWSSNAETTMLVNRRKTSARMMTAPLSSRTRLSPVFTVP